MEISIWSASVVFSLGILCVLYALWYVHTNGGGGGFRWVKKLVTHKPNADDSLFTITRSVYSERSHQEYQVEFKLSPYTDGIGGYRIHYKLFRVTVGGRRIKVDDGSKIRESPDLVEVVKAIIFTWEYQRNQEIKRMIALNKGIEAFTDWHGKIE